MAVERARIVYVIDDLGQVLPTLDGSVDMPHSEPWSWRVTIDNTGGEYGPFSDLAKVRTSDAVYRVVVKEADGSVTWQSVDLLPEEYDYDTHRVTLDGRCRLSQLDVDDQVIEAEDGLSTADGWTVAELLDAIAAHCGLSVSGAPTRVVPTFDLVGNPLTMFGDLLEPTHGFRMGSGTTIQVFELSARTTAGSLKDDADLEVVRFKRSKLLRNKATVERLVPASGGGSGPVELLNLQRSGGDTLGIQGPFEFSEPSNHWWFERRDGYRGTIHSVSPKDGDGEPVGSQPLIQSAYVNTTPAAAITFVYEPGEDASSHGPWTPNYDVLIYGFKETDAPAPTEGFSSTKHAGAGDRPYPEPFSCVSIATKSDGDDAAQALVDKGTRMGQLLNLQTRLRPSRIWLANSKIDCEDYLSEIDQEVVLENTSISWSESDSGTIYYECTFAEES